MRDSPLITEVPLSAKHSIKYTKPQTCLLNFLVSIRIWASFLAFTLIEQHINDYQKKKGSTFIL